MGKRRSHGKKRKNRPKNVDPPKFTLCDLDNNKYENYDKQREVVNELVAEICRVVKQSTPKSEWSLRGYEKFVIPRKDKWINESMAKEWAQMIEEICKGRKEDIAVSNGQVLTKGFEYVDEHSLPSTKTHMVAHVVHLLTEHIRGPSILDCPQSKVKMSLLETVAGIQEKDWIACHAHIDFVEERCLEIRELAKLQEPYGKSPAGPILLIIAIDPFVLDIWCRCVSGSMKSLRHDFQMKHVEVEPGQILMLHYDCVHRTGSPVNPKSMYSDANTKAPVTVAAKRLHILFDAEQTLYEVDGEMVEKNQTVPINNWLDSEERDAHYNKWLYCHDNGKIELRTGYSVEPTEDKRKSHYDATVYDDDYFG